MRMKIIKITTAGLMMIHGIGRKAGIAPINPGTTLFIGMIRMRRGIIRLAGIDMDIRRNNDDK
jgi:hypothetical protein